MPLFALQKLASEWGRFNEGERIPNRVPKNIRQRWLSDGIIANSDSEDAELSQGELAELSSTKAGATKKADDDEDQHGDDPSETPVTRTRKAVTKRVPRK